MSYLVGFFSHYFKPEEMNLFSGMGLSKAFLTLIIGLDVLAQYTEIQKLDAISRETHSLQQF
jgi:hypothetical protein